MTNEAKSSCKVKDHGNSSGAETSNATGLRRSGRETPSKKIRCPSPPSSRKSEQLEERTPPATRKSERLEKQSTPYALRRSERGKKQFSSSSSGSKKSNKRLDLIVMKKKFKKEKSLSRLTLEPEQNVTEPAQIGQKIKNARASEEICKQKARKLDVLGSPASRNIFSGIESGEKVQDLRDVSTGKDLEQTSSNCSVSKLPNELLETEGGQEPPCSSKNIMSAGACPSEVGDSVKDSESGDSPLLSADKVMSRKLDLDGESEKKNMNSELTKTTSNERAVDSDVRQEISYEEISLKRKGDELDPESDTIDFLASGNKLEETCTSCFKRKRDNHGSKQEEICLCGAKSNQIRCGAIMAEEGNGSDVAGEAAGKPIINLQPKDLPEDNQIDGDQDTCLTCKLHGNLLYCEGKGCKSSYHVSCLDPPLKDIPLEVWYCLACVEKTIKLGAHSVSEGIESIWKVEMSEENGSQKRQFFVKYKGLAHVHNRWVSESLLLLQSPSLLAKFNQKNQVSSWKDEWTEPHRMLQKRLLRSLKQFDEVHEGHADDVFHWLVKWRGLDYENATWELQNASFMKLPKAQSLIRDYENRLERAKKRTYKEVEVEEGSVKPMQLSAGGSTKINNIHLKFCNSLRAQWHSGKNVVIINDPERLAKVVKFVASLSSDGFWPFLIISSSVALWDEEFFHFAPSIAVVVYQGSKDTRRKIRTLEFSVEGGGVMFDVLVTSPEVVVEDVDVFQFIKWEAVIVDGFQHSRMYSHFGQFKSLSTKMRLLLVNGQLKDSVIEHLLPLLDCHSDASSSEGLITNSNNGIRDLKEKLSKYNIGGSESDTSRFIEYWVPVQISNAQLEQYCATLLSNSLPLCSSSNPKTDPIWSFRDIVISNRKCCDHPYITDSLLPKHLTKDLQVTDFLDVGINVCGKLQLLDAMLVEIRNRGLRVIVLFQSTGGSPKDNIGDILDDFVRQRFGENSYERLEVLVSPGRKQTALNKFNNQQSRFVVLLETRACAPSIKLSSVDTVIIFGSDWNPANDLRNLQKITLDTPSQELKVFRLYSSFTVEENALILAKHRKPVHSNLQNINRASSHSLLMWGVSDLFCKLDEFHGCPTLAASGITSLEPVSHKDIVREFLNILAQNAKVHTSGNSIILKAKQNQGNYSTDLPLPGEQKIQESNADLPHEFWKKLFDRKQPQWKYTSGLSQCSRKRAQHRDEVLKKAEGEIEEVMKKRKKVTSNNFGKTSARLAAAENEVVSGGFEAVPHSVQREFDSGSPTHLNANHVSTLISVAHNNPELLAVDMAKFGERSDMRDSQKSLHGLLNPDIAKLCEILQLPEDVKMIAQSFLEYIVNNHCVIKEPATVLQAFCISLCWTAASMLKHKVDRKETFELAKKHLDFCCRREEADCVYSMLRDLKKMFKHSSKNLKPAYSAETSDPLSKVVNKVHHGKSSLSTSSGRQQEKDKFEDLAHNQESVDDQVLSVLGQHGSLKSIKDIEEKCNKQMTKLLQKQQDEIAECKTNYKNEKTHLVNKKRTEAAVIRLHSSSLMRADKLMRLDAEYKEKFEELNHRMEMDLENLQKRHTAAMETVEKRKDSLLQGFMSWKRRDFNGGNSSLLNSIESMQDREARVCEIPPDGQVVVDKGIASEISNSSERIAVVTQQNEDTPSGVPEIAGQFQGNETREQQDVEATSTVPKTGDVVKFKESCKQDGKVQVTDDVDDEQSQSLDQSDMELVPGVKGSDQNEVAADISFDDEITELREMGPTLSARPSQEDDINLRQSSEIDGRLVERDGVSAVNNEDSHPHVSYLARQGQDIQQTASTRSEDRPPAIIEIDDPLQQFEPLVANIASDHTNTDVLQMPSTDPDFSPDATDLPSAGEYQGNISIAASSVQMLGNQIEHSNQAVPHLPVETLIGTRTVPVSSRVTNCSTQTVPPSVRVPHLGFCRDPLQNELERIRKETDHIISIHENTKLQLRSDCEKEIQDIRRKYENKLQEVETEFVSRKKDLDLNHSVVLMNKILAGTFRLKCIDTRGSSAPGQQQAPVSGPPSMSAAPSMHQSSGPMSAAPSMHKSSASVSVAPTLRPMHHSILGNLARRPLINSISPVAGNAQIVSEVRAPAPHLQPFRPAAASANPSSPAVGVVSQRGIDDMAMTLTTPSQTQPAPQ